MTPLTPYVRLLGAYMRVNWRSALEYRTNFVFEMVLSVLEVTMYIFYWKLFFDLSDGVQGMRFAELAALVAFNHVIYAGADTLMGNHVWDTGEMIIRGQLDIFLVQPKSAVYQIFFSGAQPARAIQIVTGTILFFLFLPVTPETVGLYLFGVVVGTSIFSSWVVMLHTLTFLFGNTLVVYKLMSVILHFAKKPANIFSLAIRVILYSIIPAAYVGSIQARQLFSPSTTTILLLTVAAIVAPILAASLFRLGMRRYESGNLVGARV